MSSRSAARDLPALLLQFEKAFTGEARDLPALLLQFEKAFTGEARDPPAPPLQFEKALQRSKGSASYFHSRKPERGAAGSPFGF